MNEAGCATEILAEERRYSISMPEQKVRYSHQARSALV
jgi:hypothetical protein